MKPSIKFILASLCLSVAACSSSAESDGARKEVTLKSETLAVESAGGAVDFLKYAVIVNGDTRKVIVQTIDGQNCKEGVVTYSPNAIFPLENRGAVQFEVNGGSLSEVGRRSEKNKRADRQVAVIPSSWDYKCRKLETKDRTVYPLAPIENGFASLPTMSAQLGFAPGRIPKDLEVGSLHGVYGRAVFQSHTKGAVGVLIYSLDAFFNGDTSLDNYGITDTFDVWVADKFDTRLEEDQKSLRSYYDVRLFNLSESKHRYNQPTEITKEEKQEALEAALRKLGY